MEACKTCPSPIACAGADMCLADVQRYRDAAPLCPEHQPSGGKRGVCLVCAIERMSAALSRIDYLCGEPNEMGVSDYDIHCNEDAVVERVAKRLKSVYPKRDV